MSEPEGVDLPALRSYFAQHVAGATDAELHAELIAGGRSNLTYTVTDGTSTWVLRRPPLGHVLPTAHDMSREYRVMTALGPTDVPVPRTFALCEDEDVIGAPFYVMECVEGTVMRDEAAVAAMDEPAGRRCSEALVDVLCAIHLVDYEAVGLGDFGHPEGFLERQVRRFGEQLERSRHREVPGLDELGDRLRRALPASGPPTLVHGDYRLDNAMLDPSDPGRILAVLDWELATLGDPLADVGLFLLYWGEPDAQIIATGAPAMRGPGFLTSEDAVARYAERTGRDVDQLDWYFTLAAYKLAVIVEGIHARFLQGKTMGEGFEELGDVVPRLVDVAMERANASSIAALRRS